MNEIGEKIKECRKKAKMTQEQLAAQLNVTYQTVSKWETGTACPDLSLIVPLARLFRITADELLGVNLPEPDQRYDELKTAYDRTYRTEDFAKRQEICERAVAEYPGDMEWLCRLAWVISNRSFECGDDEKYRAEQEKAIRLFDAVIRNCGDERLRGDAVIGITQLLGWRGRREEAKRYARMLPERAPVSRDTVMENCLEIRFRQGKIMEYLQKILLELSLLHGDGGDELCFAKTVELLKVMIPDGNDLEFHHNLYYAGRRRVNRLLRENGRDKCVIGLLDEMRRHAEAYDRIVFEYPGVYRYTSPLFDRIETDTRDWLGNEGGTLTEDFREFVNDPMFDPLRGSEAFQTAVG